MKKANLLLTLVLPLSIGLTSGTITNTPNEISPVIQHNIERTASSVTFDDEPLKGDIGSKKGSPFEVNGITYQNYTYGYGRGSSLEAVTYHAEKNVNSDGSLTLVGIDYFLNKVGATYDSGNEAIPDSVDKADCTAALKAEFKKLYEAGVAVGIPSSSVKYWDKACVTQDFTNGDSTFSWGGNDTRVNVTFLMYEPGANEAFSLRNSFASTWNSNKTLLYPISDEGTQSVVLPGETVAKDLYIQIFNRGFIYLNGGTPVVKVGYSYDSATHSFTAVASPYVPSEYGNQTDVINGKNGTIIYVYENGSIICTLNKGVYEYQLRAFRIYSSETEFTTLDVDDVIRAQKVGSDFDNVSNFSEETKTKLRPLLKNKYRDAYESGLILGFRESAFSKSWNGVSAQQFKLGDSTACPWEGTRTNIAALVWNQVDNTIVILKDNPLYLWNKNYAAYGYPAEDAFNVDNDVFQQFSNGLLVINQNKTDLAFFYDGTYDQYKAGKSTYDKPNLGDEGKTFKVTVTDNLPLYLGLGIGIPVLGIAIVLFIILRKKKQAKKA
jgi:hypothetical protein